MGNFFGGNSPDMNIDVDFNTGNFDPQTKDLIENSKQLLISLENYHGCGIKIRDALSNSNDDQLQRDAYNAVCPNIEIISRFHNFSTEVGSKIGELSTQLINVEACQSHLSELAAIGELILFCFKFDQIKMLKPEIQNDFSFYRRSLGSRAISNGKVSKPPVSSDMANVISMWLAQNLPMTSSINGRQTRHNAVSHLANVCCGMILRNVSPNEHLKIMNIMVGATVVYDRISPDGAFVSNTQIRIRKVVKVISSYDGNERSVLANSLKYSTIHLNDPTTPDSIKNEIMNL
mmetsp:Transcript_14957/g.15691  ORF Transcript_14957/g.15691 Transcript_14957/m.15691 type:complete len:290 (-) Transcript_14957:698-1567(-)